MRRPHQPGRAPVFVQRKCDACESEKYQEHIFRREDGPAHAVTADVAPRLQSARSGGQPLPAAVRKRFESGFAFDFSRVRVHSDQESDALASSLHARAFTVGNDVFFRTHEYRPRVEEGQRLLAHELAHVVQQRAHSPIASDRSLSVSSEADPAEREADSMADAFLRGDAAAMQRVNALPATSLLQRESDTESDVEDSVRDSTAVGNLAQASPAQIDEAESRGGMVVHSSARTPEEEPLIRQAQPVPTNTVECVKKWTPCSAPYSPGSWGLRVTYHCPRLILPWGIIVPGDTRPAYVTVPDEFIGPDSSGRDTYRCRPGAIVRIRADIADAFATGLTRSTLYPSFDACHAGFRAFLGTALEAIFAPSGGGRPAGIRVNAPPPPATHPCP